MKDSEKLDELLKRMGEGDGRRAIDLSNEYLEIARKITGQLEKASGYWYKLGQRNPELMKQLKDIKSAYLDYNENVRNALASTGRYSVEEIERYAKRLDFKLKAFNKRFFESESQRNEIAKKYGAEFGVSPEKFIELSRRLEIVKDSVADIGIEIEKVNAATARFERKVDAVTYGIRAMGFEIKRVGNRWIEFQDRAMKNARAMGKDREEAVAYFERSLQYTRELGRRYGLTHEQIVKFQTDYTEATGKAIDLTKKQTETIAAMGTLSTPETANKMADEMDRFGGSIEDAAFYMQLTQERAKMLGLNPKKAAESIAQNMKLASTYTFKNGIDGMARMAIEAQRLRVSLEGVVKATENFDDIEKAITNSAKIQMLGGSFAANYSNPMGVLFESLNDPERFFKRMQRTLAGKGVFNKETGQVDVAAIDRRFIKEFAQYAGVSFEEAMQMTQSITKNKEVEAALRTNPNNFSPAQTAFIQAQAQWDAESRQFKLTDQTSGEQIALKDLTVEKLKELQGNTLGEKEMWGDVRDIRDHLLKDIKDRQLRRASETMSLKENREGFYEARDAAYAKGINGIMKRIAGSLNTGLLAKLADTFTAILPAFGALVLGVLAKGVYSGVMYSVRGSGSWLRRGVRGGMRALGLGAGGASAGAGGASAGAGGATAGAGGATAGAGGATAGAGGATAGAGGATAGAGGATAGAGGATAGAGGAETTLRSASKFFTPDKMAVARTAAKVGGITGALFGAYDWWMADKAYKSNKEAIEQSDVSESIKKRMELDNLNERNDARGGAIGGAIGSALGSAIGSFFGPGLGTAIGGALGYKMGQIVGNGVNKMFGNSRSDEDIAKSRNQHYFETAKLGVEGNETLDDIQYKAAVATIGIHDLMITNYNRSKGLREDGTRRSFWSRFTGGDTFAHGGIVHAREGAIIGGDGANNDLTPVWANPGEAIFTRDHQKWLFDYIREQSSRPPSLSSISVKALPVIGGATNISQMNSSAIQSPSISDTKKLDLNISGSIRFESNGGATDIDIIKLFDNPSVRRQFADMILSRVNENSNSGKKNMESYRNNMATQFNKVGR